MSTGNLTNATAIGNGANVSASNKIRLGNTAVTVIEGQVAFTFPSDKTKKENFQPVDGEAVLGKIRGFELSSWNFIGTILKSFATMVRWRKTSLRPSAKTASDRSARRRRSTLATWRGFLCRRAVAGEAHGGDKTEGGADCGAGIEGRRANSEVRYLNDCGGS